MAYEDRSYSGSAVETTLTANITNVTTAIPIASSTGWPDGTGGPFHIAIAPANNPEAFSEVIRCSGRTGLTLNVQTTPVSGRGWDGTTASAHLAGAIVAHVMTATDLEEANQHITNTGLDHHSQYLTVARHDLSARHGIANLPVGGSPSASVVGDTSYAGTSGLLPRSDHRHAREGFGSPVATGPVNNDGTASTLPRSDHKHAGGIPILTSSTRPASPITGEAIIESDTFRNVHYTGSVWVRSSHFSVAGRTGVTGVRSVNFAIPDGGASTHIIPFNSESGDSDGFLPTPDGTTTTTLTVPSGVSGLYIAALQLVWSSIITARAYVEVVHNDGVGLFQFRHSTTGEDRGFVTTALALSSGHTVQMGAWQNSGGVVNIYGYLYLYRLFA